MQFAYAFGGIALLVILVIALAIIKRAFQSKGSRKNTVLLAGLQNAGKTTFYYKLRDGKIHRTYTSMTENEDTFVPSLTGGDAGEVHVDIPLYVVDIPGHERLRSKIRQYLPIAATILFFVDSVDFASVRTESAEYLYDILTNRHVVNNQVAVCIISNKSDISLFKKEHIKRQLETELEKVHKTKANQMDLQMNQEENRDMVDLVNDDSKPFTFDDNCQVPVSFVDCSVTKGHNLDKVLHFISENTQ